MQHDRLELVLLELVWPIVATGCWRKRSWCWWHRWCAVRGDADLFDRILCIVILVLFVIIVVMSFCI